MQPVPNVLDITDEKFDRQVLRLIRRELGLTGQTRFIRLNGFGTGEHVAERHQWLVGMAIEDIARELEKESPPLSRARSSGG